MGLVAIIGLIINLLRALPDLVRLIKAIMDLFRQLKPGSDRRALLAEFREALEYAKRTKDTSKLDAFHQKLVGLCHDDACVNRLDELRHDQLHDDGAPV
jgi:hypothetical protein